MELLAAILILLAWAFFVFCPMGAYVWTRRPYGKIIPRNRKIVLFYYAVLVSSMAMWALASMFTPLYGRPRTTPSTGFFSMLLMIGAFTFFVTTLLGPFVADELLRTARKRQPNVCIECGYDLTGNVSGVCPECGTKVADASPIEE